VGGLVTGLFTVIQAAAASVLAALLIGWARRRLNATEFLAALKRTCLQSGALFAISFGAKAFTVLVAGADMSTAMIEWMTASSIDGWMVIAVIVLALLLMGMFLDPAGIILLAVPVTLPVVMGLGYDVVWYAVIFVKVLEIGLITPPLGLNIFALKASLDAAETVPLEDVYKGALAFLAIDLVVLALLLAFPDISLLLPDLLGQ
ncbi:MAG: TRAP transporter large permease subunit, partial [Gemmatimonadetes bacterium]|nr:TRAP transporter large permease subunit [Gemmatimonadota bacterium]